MKGSLIITKGKNSWQHIHLKHNPGKANIKKNIEKAALKKKVLYYTDNKVLK